MTSSGISCRLSIIWSERSSCGCAEETKATSLMMCDGVAKGLQGKSIKSTWSFAIEFRVVNVSDILTPAMHSDFAKKLQNISDVEGENFGNQSLLRTLISRDTDLVGSSRKKQNAQGRVNFHVGFNNPESNRFWRHRSCFSKGRWIEKSRCRRSRKLTRFPLFSFLHHKGRQKSSGFKKKNGKRSKECGVIRLWKPRKMKRKSFYFFSCNYLAKFESVVSVSIPNTFTMQNFITKLQVQFIDFPC